MTHPLTPREKVVFKQPCEHCQRMTTVDLTALASGSGDHAELARLTDEAADFGVPAKVDPAVLNALLAENAALRAERDGDESAHYGLLEKYEEADNALGIERVLRTQWEFKATEAERKLAEAVGLLGEARGDLVATAEADTPEWSRRVYESSRADYEQDMDLPNRIGAFIASLSSKEAERG